MFLGSFKTFFSGKNRLILPKRFRRELRNEDRFYIYLGENGEIWGFNSEGWRQQADRILQIPLTSDTGRKERLHFFPKTEECLLDSQGRFILPQEFIDKVAFKNEVVIVGAGDHFEIWDPGRLRDEIENQDDKITR